MLFPFGRCEECCEHGNGCISRMPISFHFWCIQHGDCGMIWLIYLCIYYFSTRQVSTTKLILFMRGCPVSPIPLTEDTVGLFLPVWQCWISAQCRALYPNVKHQSHLVIIFWNCSWIILFLSFVVVVESFELFFQCWNRSLGLCAYSAGALP